MISNDKANRVIQAAESQMGNPYVFGAWGSECTPAMRRNYAKCSPDHATNIVNKCQVLNGSSGTCTGCKWKGKLAFDCRGFTYWCLKQVEIVLSGSGATSQYKTSANWSARGEIAKMPDVVCCVFKCKNGVMQHTGLHVGGGKIIHCSNGVQTGKTTDKGWTHYAIPIGLYDEVLGNLDSLDLEKPGKLETLKRGSSGEAVQDLQDALNQLGFNCGEADGKFGSKTDAAVRAFQAAYGLTVDGLAGTKTRHAIAQALEMTDPDDPAEDPAESSETTEPEVTKSLEVPQLMLTDSIGRTWHPVGRFTCKFDLGGVDGNGTADP